MTKALRELAVAINNLVRMRTYEKKHSANECLVCGRIDFFDDSASADSWPLQTFCACKKKAKD